MTENNKESFPPVREQLSGIAVTLDDGITRITLTNNVKGQIGIELAQRIDKDNYKRITTYQTVEDLARAFERIGYTLEEDK